ncbi:MAG: hypothetical protein AB7O56_09485 [Bauldia sp.]
MHIGDVRDAIGGDDAGDVQEAFRAIICYPGPVGVDGATADDLIESLERLCEKLAEDYTEITHDLAVEIEGLQRTPLDSDTYAAAAFAVRANFDRWRDYLRNRANGVAVTSEGAIGRKE